MRAQPPSGSELPPCPGPPLFSLASCPCRTRPASPRRQQDDLRVGSHRQSQQRRLSDRQLAGVPAACWVYWLASGHAPTYEQLQLRSTLNPRPPRSQIVTCSLGIAETTPVEFAQRITSAKNAKHCSSRSSNHDEHHEHSSEQPSFVGFGNIEIALRS